MSEALDYLLKARPEAMGAYFTFLKGAGTHLDVKTRDLISVITKVHAQTERGLKQYLTRALRDGCTPNEIIDALLMAFPTLGLTKIMWAVDVILGMNLPGFDLAALADKPEWRDVAAVAELPDGQAVRKEFAGRGVFLYRDAEDVTAYDTHCPHKATDIPLALEGTTLTCPRHEWKFDITSGACIDKGDKPLTRLDCKVEGGRVLVFW